MAVKAEPLCNLAEHLTEAERVILADAHGGTRVYVPATLRPSTKLVQAIGVDAARRLRDAIGPGIIKLPLERELRAKHYRAQGESYARIARRLGLTEAGVAEMLAGRKKHTR